VRLTHTVAGDGNNHQLRRRRRGLKPNDVTALIRNRHYFLVGDERVNFSTRHFIGLIPAERIAEKVQRR
jgi:hypothetical protein